MKKFSLIFLILALTVLLCSCSSTSNAYDSTNKDEVTSTYLTTENEATSIAVTSTDIAETTTESITIPEIPTTTTTETITTTTITTPFEDIISHPPTQTPCIHDAPNETFASFHTYPLSLVEYVGGSDVVQKWIDKVRADNTDRCEANIYRFIKDFNIPRDYFENTVMYAEFVNDYNLDVLYSNDYEMVKEYYTSLESRLDELYERFYKNQLKLEMVEKYVDETIYENWIQEKIAFFNKDNDNENEMIISELFCWSIPELIYKFDINRYDFEKTVAELNYTIISSRNNPISININAIYSNKEYFLEKILNTTTIKDIIEQDKLVSSDLAFLETKKTYVTVNEEILKAVAKALNEDIDKSEVKEWDATGKVFYTYYYSIYLYGLDGLYGALVEEDKQREWLNQYKNDIELGIRKSTELNIINFFIDMNISMEECLEVSIKDSYYSAFTPDDIRAIFSGDKELFDKELMNPDCLYYNGKIYTPEWIMNKTVADYENEGIPLETIIHKLVELDKEGIVSFEYRYDKVYKIVKEISIYTGTDYVEQLLGEVIPVQ